MVDDMRGVRAAGEYTPEWAVQFARSLVPEMSGYPRRAVELLLTEVDRLRGLLAEAGVDSRSDVPIRRQ